MGGTGSLISGTLGSEAGKVGVDGTSSPPADSNCGFEGAASGSGMVGISFPLISPISASESSSCSSSLDSGSSSSWASGSESF